MSATQDDDEPAYRGGCRPGMFGCRRGSCGHRAIVEAYREARDAQRAQAEREALGYDTELETFYETHPKITFRWWLEQLVADRLDDRDAVAA